MAVLGGRLMRMTVRLPRGRAIGAVLASAAVLALTSCSATGAASSDVTADSIRADAKRLKAKGYTEQAALLEDGVVTAAEYETAFQQFSQCVSDMGYEVADLTVNPVDGITYLFGVDPKGRDENQVQEARDTCAARYWDHVGPDYSATAPKHMDEALRQGALACMAKAGYKLTGTESSFREFAGEDPLVNGSQSKRMAAAVKCFNDEVPKVLPDVTVWAMSLD